MLVLVVVFTASRILQKPVQKLVKTGAKPALNLDSS